MAFNADVGTGNSAPTLPAPVVSDPGVISATDLQNAINAAGGGSKADQIAAMRVYLGPGYGGHGVGGGIMSSVAEAQGSWYRMSDQERLSLGRTLYSFGLISNPNDYQAVQNAWNQAVVEAAYYNQAGRQVSPYDVMGLMAGLTTGWRTQDGKNGLMNAPGGKGGTRTDTASRVDLPSRDQVKGIITDIFKNELGRSPTANDVSRYMSILTGAAKANPQKATTTTTTRADGSSTSSTVTSGGYDPAVVAKGHVEGTQEYSTYQAATTYMNALLQAIGNP